jgi:GTP cyclohydrolase II
MDADGLLGFGHDERNYESGIAILKHLGIERIQLLTNNPEKVRAVESAGIRVLDRKPLHGRLNRHNQRYVHAKAHRAGHWLMDMINESIAGD